MSDLRVWVMYYCEKDGLGVKVGAKGGWPFAPFGLEGDVGVPKGWKGFLREFPVIKQGRWEFHFLASSLEDAERKTDEVLSKLEKLAKALVETWRSLPADFEVLYHKGRGRFVEVPPGAE